MISWKLFELNQSFTTSNTDICVSHVELLANNTKLKVLDIHV